MKDTEILLYYGYNVIYYDLLSFNLDFFLHLVYDILCCFNQISPKIKVFYNRSVIYENLC